MKTPGANGFTLIELMVTLTVAAILAAIAIPAFSNFLHDDRDISQVNSLVGSLNYARSEAVKRAAATGVKVCPSLDGVQCTASAWSGGWIVLFPGPNTVLQAVPALSGNNVLTNPTNNVGGITFHSSGIVDAPLTIKICDTRGSAFARDVEVNATGRIGASQTHGISASQAPLVCP